MIFGKRLRDLRLERKLRQEDLAKIIKVHRATIGKYETEERFPDKETLLILANYFNVSVDFLLGRSDVRQNYTIEEPSSTVQEIEPEIFRDIDVAGLPEEAIRQIKDYVEFIKQKYKRTN